MNIQYPYLEQIGVKVYEFPIPHVKPDELKSALNKVGISEAAFVEVFGTQTVLLCENQTSGPAAQICERILSQILK